MTPTSLTWTCGGLKSDLDMWWAQVRPGHVVGSSPTWTCGGLKSDLDMWWAQVRPGHVVGSSPTYIPGRTGLKSDLDMWWAQVRPTFQVGLGLKSDLDIWWALHLTTVVSKRERTRAVLQAKLKLNYVFLVLT
ncbi:hypothetical protein CgunFtcFv8_011341 [Champsocephalus gunnari]|uniref:Uncharacterized protein n=1 Tax=Champsocephalus gunnari TaxID=52237 RepID=A0AAN8DEN3_CHAGU|nr:hypothetical protein CgunFtcFv8_011341 [Champsocephalus gunnari]